MTDSLTETIQEAAKEESGDSTIEGTGSEANIEYLDQLVGEGKQYATVEDLAKAAAHKDNHIKTLEKENSNFRSKDDRVDEILKNLETLKPAEQTKGTETPADEAPVSKSKETADIDIAELVNTQIKNIQSEDLRKKNVGESQEKLLEVYGSITAVSEAFETVINGDTNTKAIYDRMGEVDPDRLVEVLTNLVPPTEGMTNTPGSEQGTGSNGAGVKGGIPGVTWTQAKKMEKDHPFKFNSPEYQDKVIAQKEKYEAKGLNFFKS